MEIEHLEISRAFKYVAADEALDYHIEKGAGELGLFCIILYPLGLGHLAQASDHFIGNAEALDELRVVLVLLLELLAVMVDIFDKRSG